MVTRTVMTAGTGTDGRASQGEDGIVLDIWMFLDIAYPHFNRFFFKDFIPHLNKLH